MIVTSFLKKKLNITTALPYINNTIHIGHIYEFYISELFIKFNKINKISSSGIDCHGLIKKNKIKKILFLNKKKINFFNLKIKLNKTISLINKRFCNWVYIVMCDKNYIFSKITKNFFNIKNNFFIPDKYIEIYCKNCKIVINNLYCICNNKITFKTNIEKKIILFKKSFNLYLKIYYKENWNFSRNLKYNGFLIISKKKIFFYVWYDAIISYVSNNIYNNDFFFNKKIIQFYGKDIDYFHKIFNIILKILKYKKSKTFVHGFLHNNNFKISKSKKNYIEKKVKINYFKFFILFKHKNNFNDINININKINFTYKKFFFCKIINLFFRIRFLFKKFDNKTSEFFIFKKKHKIKNFFKFNISIYIKKIIFISNIINKNINKNFFWKKKNFYLIQILYTKYIKNIYFNMNIIFDFIFDKKLKKKIYNNKIFFNLKKFYEN